MTKRELLDVWFKRVWEEEDASAIYEFYASEGHADGLGDAHQAGPDEFVAFHRMLLNLVRVEKVSFSQVIEEGDWISYMGAFDLVDRRTNKTVQLTGGAMCKIRDDKIVLAHNSWDFLGLFSQLGLVSEDAFMTLLGGRSLSGAEPASVG